MVFHVSREACESGFLGCAEIPAEIGLLGMITGFVLKYELRSSITRRPSNTIQDRMILQNLIHIQL